MKILSYIIIIGFMLSPIIEIILVNRLIKIKKQYNSLQVKYDDLYNSELQKIQNLLDEDRKEHTNESSI